MCDSLCVESLQAFAGKQNTFLLSATFEKKKLSKCEAPAAYDEDDMVVDYVDLFLNAYLGNRFLCEHLSAALSKQPLHMKA